MQLFKYSCVHVISIFRINTSGGSYPFILFSKYWKCFWNLFLCMDCNLSSPYNCTQECDPVLNVLLSSSLQKSFFKSLFTQWFRSRVLASGILKTFVLSIMPGRLIRITSGSLSFVNQTTIPHFNFFFFPPSNIT